MLTNGAELTMSTEPYQIALAWTEAANQQDQARLLNLSDPQIEIIGPRGSGYGVDLLLDWLSRAGLSLETHRIFARHQAVVLLQHGSWHSVETGEMIGEAEVASRFEVQAGKVKTLERDDNLQTALTKAGLQESDEIKSV